jgi:hypothetical protein
MKEGGEVSEDLIRAQNQVALVAICEVLNHKGSEGPPPPIIVATTHLKSSRSATGERYRLKEILQVLGVIQSMQNCLLSMGRPGAVLLAGDMNAVPTTDPVEPLTYRAIKNFGGLPLRSVYTEDFPDSFPVQARYLGATYMPYTYLSIVRKGAHEEVLKRCIGECAAVGASTLYVSLMCVCIDYIFYTPFKQLPPPTVQSVVRLKRGVRTDLLITFLVRSLYYFFVCSIASACIIESTVYT